jgi:hypothetical protein
MYVQNTNGNMLPCSKPIPRAIPSRNGIHIQHKKRPQNPILSARGQVRRLTCAQSKDECLVPEDMTAGVAGKAMLGNVVDTIWGEFKHLLGTNA